MKVAPLSFCKASVVLSSSRLLVAVVALGAAVVVHAGAKGESSGVAFVETTSELDESRSATSMWNLTDDNDGTVWCSRKGASGKEAISFTFNEPVAVSAVGLVLPVASDGATDKRVRRPRVIVVADVTHRVEVRVKDVTAMQLVELPEPAKGRRVVVEILETFPGASDDAPICAAGIGLRDRGHELLGNTAARARGQSSAARRFLHEWHDDVSAPSRTLTLSVDGSFTYTYAPLLESTQPVRMTGRWTGDSNSIAFDVKGKSYVMKAQLTKVASENGHSVELALTGRGPDPSMTASFRPAPLFLPE